MKIFAFSGSLNPTESVCDKVILDLVDSLRNYLDEPIELFYRKSHTLNIEFNRGTAEEFTQGKQYIGDDVVNLEEEMVSSDMIILASPVYGQFVSGYMKNFLDRISYWTHILRLAGKTAITIVCTSSSGERYTSLYLTTFLQHLGCVVLGNLEIKSAYQDTAEIQDYIHEKCKIIAKKISQKDFTISDLQEAKFQYFKDKYQDSEMNKEKSAEYTFWVENGFLQYDDYKSLFFNAMSKNTNSNLLN